MENFILDNYKQEFINDIYIHNLTMSETLDVIDDTIQKSKQIHHTVINAGKIVSMSEDKELFQSVVEADLINVDGQAIVWASNFLGKPIKERVSGIDLMIKLVEVASIKNYKLFFLGATEDVVKKVVDLYSSTYSNSIIAGYRNGYFKLNEELEVANEINKSGANILFVAISSPMKEIFLHKYKEQLKNVNFIMGVGGSFDVIAGKVKRAPLWMQKAGLEWLYRVIQEPKRMWKRYLVGNTKFILMILKLKLEKVF